MTEVISIPAHFLGVRPWINTTKYVRLIEGGRDVTPEPDHRTNRRNCRMANDQNRAFFSRWPGCIYKFYHYDAMREEALEFDTVIPRSGPPTNTAAAPPSTTRGEQQK